MDILIESLGDDEKKMGLTKGRLRMAVESRLRSARLYSGGSGGAFFEAYLYVNVGTFDSAFSISVEYHKWVTDGHGYVGAPSTWKMRSTGLSGKIPSFIISGLSELLDLFIAEYLRVNEESCEEK